MFLASRKEKFLIYLEIKIRKMIKFILILISCMSVLILVNLNNVISFSEDFSNQTTKTNNTNFDISIKSSSV